MPFLRGGGRAVTLEGLTLAERQLLYQIRTFAKFRQEFLITTLAGGSFPNFGTRRQHRRASRRRRQPRPDDRLPQRRRGHRDRREQPRNVATYEQFFEVYKELIKGEASGLTQLQLDQLDANLQKARIEPADAAEHVPQRPRHVQAPARPAARHPADGRPPAHPAVQARSTTRSRSGRANPSRQLAELDQIAARLPELEDVIDRRPVVPSRSSASGKRREPRGPAARRRAGLAGESPGLDERPRTIVRCLAADPRHGQRAEGRAQRQRHQPDPHPAHHHQPVRLPRPGQAVLARAQRRAAAGPDGRAEQLPDGPDQLPAAAPAAAVPGGLPEAPAPQRRPRPPGQLPAATRSASGTSSSSPARRTRRSRTSSPRRRAGGAAGGAATRGPTPRAPSRPRT